MHDISYVIYHTTMHSERVAMIAGLIVDELQKKKEYQWLDKRNIQILSLVHDIGKYLVRPALIAKKSALDESEWIEIKEHATYSYEMLKSLELSEKECNIVRWHHEKLDGSGYPDGMAGKLIPIETQIITVADIYDAMISKRPYREKEYKHVEAIESMRRDKGLNQDFVNIADTIGTSWLKDRVLIQSELDSVEKFSGYVRKNVV